MKLQDTLANERHAEASLLRPQNKLVEGLNKEETLKKFLPKISKVAKRVAIQMGQLPHLDDLMSTGMMGLLDAFDRFQERDDVRFATYAEHRIRGSMIDEIRNQSWVPRSVLRKTKMLQKLHEKFERDFGRRGTDAEIARAIGLKAADLPKFEESSLPAKVLNIEEYRNFNDRDRESFVEKSEEQMQCPSVTVERRSTQAVLEQVAAHLSEKQRRVIELYYFDGLKNLEISQTMGITESRVSQLHKSALEMLRRSQDLKLLFACLYKAA